MSLIRRHFLLSSVAMTTAACGIPAHTTALTSKKDRKEAVFTFSKGISVGHWLAKFDANTGYGGKWFGPADVHWIKQQGFDHIRYPVDGRLWWNMDRLDESYVGPFEEIAEVTAAAGLGVVLDMHFLPGGGYDRDRQDPAIFTDAQAQRTAADFIEAVAGRLLRFGEELRFELINEPFAPDDSQLNALNLQLIRSVRNRDANRVLYFTSNQSSTFRTLPALDVPEDPHTIILLHYDEPMVFTHQKTPWKHYPAGMPDITFPGTVPNLDAFLPEGHEARTQAGRDLSEAAVRDDFDRAAEWLAEHAPGKPVYLGAFGVYQKAPEPSRRHYLETVRKEAERLGWGWCVWDYKSVFGVFNPDGSATPALAGLFAPPSPL